MDVEIYFNERQKQILWALYDDPDLTDDELAKATGNTASNVKLQLRLMRAAFHKRSTMGLVVTLIKDGWFDKERVIGDDPTTSTLGKLRSAN